ncbi:hypothetical protein TeGR_g9472 [Tetraparma gracilis]|nr:hypothetical protein TeGR_g9472 [Tetraparma gracilis]
MSSLAAGARASLSVATWNVAAINNNPFEYWLTLAKYPAYNAMMSAVEDFVEAPGDKDVPVGSIFTDAMYDQLERRMQAAGWEGLPAVRGFWEGDYRGRAIVSGFLKDKSLGAKRLTSMPDRITNTINVVGAAEPVCRPTTINMYGGDLGTLDGWWGKWSEFIFDTPLTIRTKGGEETLKVYEMLSPILSTKYPAITPAEESVSLPLQTLAHAIFDCIQVHMLNSVSGPEVWQPMRREIVEALNRKKVPNTLKIIAGQYANMDIVCLQEVSAAFIGDASANPTIASNFHIVAPHELDGKRDQNSVILLSKARFPDAPPASAELTAAVEANFPPGPKPPVAKGDIIAITVKDAFGDDYVVASFHGDTNGLATVPVLNALDAAVKKDPALAGHDVVFGLDANTYEKVTKSPPDKQDVMLFGQEYVKLGYSSNWGDVPSPTQYTTYNARTYLQPQLNKACRSAEKKECGDVNPKDFILFKKAGWSVESMAKDNTGKGTYVEDMPFPTLEFPSDHGVLSTVLKRD